MKISVIIPAYNVEKYISESLNSVLYSDYEDFEIILINDGSTDKTDKICRDYLNKYDNIIYLQQENQGASVARNLGLRYAKGDWVVFLDADDKISKDFLNLVSVYSKDCDILFFGYTNETNKDKRKEKQIRKTDISLRREIIYNTIAGKQLSGQLKHIKFPAVHAKAYQRKFLLKNKLGFPNNIKIGEDLLFNLQCYIAMENGKLCKELVYNITTRPGSVSYKYYENFIQIDREFHIRLIYILKSKGLYNEYKEALYESILNGFWQILMRRIYIKNSKEDEKQQYKILKEVRKDKIYNMAFQFTTLKKICRNDKFTVKQKLILYLIKFKIFFPAHKFIILWQKSRELINNFKLY